MTMDYINAYMDWKIKDLFIRESQRLPGLRNHWNKTSRINLNTCREACWINGKQDRSNTTIIAICFSWRDIASFLRQLSMLSAVKEFNTVVHSCWVTSFYPQQLLPPPCISILRCRSVTTNVVNFVCASMEYEIHDLRITFAHFQVHLQHGVMILCSCQWRHCPSCVGLDID